MSWDVGEKHQSEGFPSFITTREATPGGGVGILLSPHTTQPSGSHKPCLNSSWFHLQFHYLPVTVPTTRTEPLGWKPAERAASWMGVGGEREKEQSRKSSCRTLQNTQPSPPGDCPTEKTPSPQSPCSTRAGGWPRSIGAPACLAHRSRTGPRLGG